VGAAAIWGVTLELVENLSTQDKGAQAARVAILCLGGVNLKESQELEDAIKVVKCMSKSALKTHLEDWQERLERVRSPELKRYHQHISRLLTELDEAGRMEAEEAERKASGSIAIPTQVNKSMSAAKRRKQMLNSVAVRTQPSVNKIAKIKDEAGRYLKDQIEDLTQALWNSPLHELLVCDDVESLKTVLQPDTRSLLHSALQSPEKFLKLNTDEDMLPDICVLFREFEKVGRLINLQEWFDVFKAEDKDEVTQLQLQYRFVRTVSELEMLGYLKKSTRRRGHVQAVIHV